MKKTICLLLTVLLLATLCACGEDQTYTLHDGKCTIEVTSEFAANYEWVVSFSDPTVAELEHAQDGNFGVGGYSISRQFRIQGLREGVTDVFLSYRQTYEGGALSAITKFYQLTVDASGSIVSCLQLGNTMTGNDTLYVYLKSDSGRGDAWKAVSWDDSLVSVMRTGAEQDTDKRYEGIVWECFQVADVTAGVSPVTFVLYNAQGEELHSVTYEIRAADDGVTTCALLSGQIS